MALNSSPKKKTTKPTATISSYVRSVTQAAKSDREQEGSKRRAVDSMLSSEAFQQAFYKYTQEQAQTKNAALNRYATLGTPVAGMREEEAYWKGKQKSSQKSMTNALNRMGYNDDAIFDPTAKRDYNRAKEGYNLASEKLDAFDNYRAYETNAEIEAQKNNFRKMSYEDLRKTIDSGYLSSEQSKWAEDIVRTKANSEQATGRANYLNEQAARLEQELYDRYGGTPAYFGIHEQDMYSRQQKEINNLRQMAEQYAGQAWIAEGLEKGEEAVRSSTFEQDYMMVPNRVYNEQYSGIFGLISDDELQTKEGIAGARARSVMTDEEKLKYSALYNTQGADAAKRYFDSLTYDLDERLQNQKAESVTAKMDAIRNADNLVPNTGIKWLDDYVEKTAKQSLEGSAFVRARVNNLASGIGALDATFQRLTNAGGKPVNWNTESFTPHTVSQAIQESQLSQIDSAAGRFFYQTGGSMVDSLAIMGSAMLGIPGATAILGMSAATDAMLKAKERGGTDGQAVSVGILAGVAETLFEEVSLEKLLTAGTPATIVEAIKNIFLRQGFTEASEEVATTIANTITDAMIMGDKSELKQTIQNYINLGYSQEDAEKLGATKWFEDLAMDALGGFVSGAMFGAGGQAISYGGLMSDMSNISASPDVNTAMERYQQAQGRVLDENGNVRADSQTAANRLREIYEKTMQGISDYNTEYAEAVASVDRMVADGEITPAQAQVIKTEIAAQMGGDTLNERAKTERLQADLKSGRAFNRTATELTPESARSVSRAVAYDMENRAHLAKIREAETKMVKDIATNSTNLISTPQSVADNYDTTLTGATASRYFGAFRYYEEMGQQARATGNNNFAEVWKNDERYSGAITQQAAMTAFSAGYTTAAPATKIVQAKSKGTGTLTYSDEALQQLSKKVKNLSGTIELLQAFAQKTGFNINLDESMADNENAKFMANVMTIALNPRANVIAGLFHEAGHGIQRFNPQAYAQLKADMISWYGQTQGMTSMKAMLDSYAEAYKGASREELEVEMVNDAFASLFNREDAGREVAEWLAANKTEAEQKSFIEQLNDLIDRIVNWFKSLANYDDVSPVQKRTIEMQIEKAEAFRRAFLEGLDKASENAQTTMEYFASDGSGHDYSMKSFVDGLGFALDEELNIVDENGDRVTEVTKDMIRDSKIGAMIEYARENGRISEQDMTDELEMLAGILNMAIERGDNNIMMYWEIAGSMVFSALKDNSDKQYGLTVDMTTICAKTKAIVDAMSETMALLGRGLTREETEVVYYQTGKNGEPTPCPVCYVFSRWFGIGGLLDDISNFQKEYGKQSSKKDLAFAQKILDEIVEFKDSSSATKKKDYWSARDNAWKYGRIASDAKSKYNSNIASAETAIANSDTIRATIAELQTAQRVADEKTAKKLQTQINKEMKKKALLTDEERQQKFADIEEFKRKIHDIEAWQWLIKTKLSMDKDGNFTVNDKWRPVPKEILFDLNRGAEFAKDYPLTWAYRTGKGSAMGKAMMPYSDVRVGEIAQGVAKGNVKEIKMGIDPDDEIKFNPFNATDKESVKKQLDILETAVKKTRRQNLIGGMRFQSTSDFRYEYGSDYLMAFLELQALGSNVQLYTKVIEAVDFLASMGADINMSAMPLGDGYYVDDNGVRHLQSSSVTGINFDAAVEMSRKYDNTQIIMVGINRNHILTCIEGDEVTFVIPFHGSGQNVAQIAYLMDMLRENLDVMRAQDYTNYQSDHDMLKDSRKLTDEEKAKGVNSWGLTVEERERIEATRNLRMDILTGKLWTTVEEVVEVPGKKGKTKKTKVKKTVPKELTAEQTATMQASKYLGDLYRRFYLDESAREYGVSLEKDVAKQVFPYEYWDKASTYDNADVNGERFVEYCAEIGYAPRFSGYNSKGQYDPEFDFYSGGAQKGYWKLLIDRPMYSNKYDADGNWIGYGSYREQQAINVSSFQTQTIDPSWQTATYGNVMGLKNNPEKTQKIASESVAAINKGLRYDTETKTLVKKGTETRPSMGNRAVAVDEEVEEDYSRTIEDINDEYMAAVENGDEYTVQKMVDEAALRIPTLATTQRGKRIVPLHLYHGTPTFGFTQFIDEHHDVPFIYTSTNRTVAAHYAGDNHYAFVRKINKHYDGGSSVSSIIKDAESVWGVKYHVATDEEKSRAYDDVREQAVKVADKLDEYHTDINFDWDNEDDARIANAIAWVENLFWTMRDSDISSLEEMKTGQAGYVIEDVLFDIERYKDNERLVQEWKSENYKSLSDDQKKYLNYLTGYELGDVAIDIEFTIGRILANDTLLTAETKGFAVPSEIRKSLDSIHEIGAYDLYGDLGDNPFEFDANGAQFWGLKVPEIGDGYYDTDTVSKWAYDNGYTSVIMHNIYDYGDKADNYVFFNSSQLKSADPVTYDDDGNIIPVTERFNPENKDVRYSKGDRTSLTDTERRTLEKRIKEAERNAAKEKQRADHFKHEMTLTPKFTPNAEQITELATEIVTSFGDSQMDATTLEQNLKDIFWNINEAKSSGKEARKDKALSLAQDVATAVVDSTLGEFLSVSVNSSVMRDELISMETNAIMDRILQTRMAKSTKADKWNAKLQETRKALGETERYAMSEAKRADQLQSELEAYKQKMADKIAFIKAKADADHAFNRQAYEERIARVRANRDQMLREQKEYYMSRVDKLSEQKRVQKLMPKVKDAVETLRKMMTSPEEKNGNFVPDHLKSVVGDYLSGIDFVTKTMATTGVAMKSDAGELDKLMGIRAIAENARKYENGEDAIAAYYVDLPSSAAYSIDSLRYQIATRIGDSGYAKRVNDASLATYGNVHTRISDSQTLDDVYRLTKAIITAIRKVNAFYVQGRFAHITDAAKNTMDFLDGVKRSPTYNKTMGDSLLWSMSTPYYAFKRFGEGGEAVFTGLAKGWAQFGKDADEIKTFLDDLFTPEGKKKPNRDEQREWANQIVTVKATDAQNNDISHRMTATQLMSLYCLSRRDAARGHLDQGGIELKEAKVGRETLSQTKAVHLQDGWMEAFDQLSDRQKEVARKIQEWMSTVGSEWGNHVSMTRWGVRNFEEKFYFPMSTSSAGRNVMNLSDELSMNLYALANQGFTKHLQKGANNALIIDDIFSVFTAHAANMAKYHSLVLPMLDAMKWFNYSVKTNSISDDGSPLVDVFAMRQSMEEAFGTASTKYFRKLMADLNNAQAEGGAGFTIPEKMLSNYKAAAVAANLRVALLQPTAGFRAAMLINPVYLARGMAMRGGIEEMLQYSGIAKWKDMGMYDTDVGRSIRRQFQGEEKKIGEVRNKIVNASMWLAETGDKLTWGAIWNACKLEQQALHKGASYEELMNYTDERFTEVCFATQVFDSTLSRSEVMRTKNPYAKMVTAFLSEPTLSYNMVLDKFMQYVIDAKKLGKGAAWKKHGNAITRSLVVYSVTNLAAALAESIIDAFRDDDDDPWFEKFMQALWGDWSEVKDAKSALKALYGGNFMSDMTVVGKIPVLKDVISALQGYDIGGRMDTQVITSIKTMLEIWNEKWDLAAGRLDKATKATWYGNMTTWGAIYKSLQALSQASGLPAYNAARDLSWLWNETLGVLTGKTIDTYKSASERAIEGAQKNNGMTSEEAEYAKANNLSKDFIERYYTKVYKDLGSTPREAGISLKTFNEYADKKKEAGASKKDDVIKVISGLDATVSEKDSLYLMAGFAASGLDEAPWH